jgi:hypothetical protein
LGIVLLLVLEMIAVQGPGSRLFDLSLFLPFAVLSRTPQIVVVVLVLEVIVSPFTVRRSEFGPCVNLNLRDLARPSFPSCPAKSLN